MDAAHAHRDRCDDTREVRLPARSNLARRPRKACSGPARRSFDPRGDPAVIVQASYKVRASWKLEERSAHAGYCITQSIPAVLDGRDHARLNEGMIGVQTEKTGKPRVVDGRPWSKIDSTTSGVDRTPTAHRKNEIV